MNLKEKYGWSDKSLTVFLELLKLMLPKDNTLPDRHYEAKKVFCPMGLQYKKIHACPNNFILYRKEFESLNKCPRCGLSRYKVKDDGRIVRHVMKIHVLVEIHKIEESKDVLEIKISNCVDISCGTLRGKVKNPPISKMASKWVVVLKNCCMRILKQFNYHLIIFIILYYIIQSIIIYRIFFSCNSYEFCYILFLLLYFVNVSSTNLLTPSIVTFILFLYYTKSQDDNSTMQNSGVTLQAQSMHFSSRNGKNPGVASTSYYAVIEDIWEINYGTFKVPVFKCKWVYINIGVHMGKHYYLITTLSYVYLDVYFNILFIIFFHAFNYSQFQVICPASLFGINDDDFTLYISFQDIYELLQREAMLNISIIQLWINHWQLLVLYPAKNVAIWFCTLHRKPNVQIKNLIKSNQQQGGYECGYYVMNWMLNIIEGEVTNDWMEVM
uniref:Ubiquitin-like protease family profile domain-containing protein n=1 Tax=Cajanus cajan TaxID=3821 RepID=A0A151UDD5_CAJCA